MTAAADLESYVRAARYAASLPGPIVGRVYCARCSDAATLATVRKTARGLVYEAEVVDPEFRSHQLDFEESYRAATGKRAPAVAVKVLLLLGVRHPEGAVPWTRCSRHGEAQLDGASMASACRSSAKAPAKFLIHDT